MIPYVACGVLDLALQLRRESRRVDGTDSDLCKRSRRVDGTDLDLCN
jgi:hypothetical protein